MDLEDIRKRSQAQMVELTKLINEQNKSILDQSNQLILDMKKQMGSILPPPQVDPFIEILARLEKIESDLADLKILQHKPVTPSSGVSSP